MIIKPRSKDTKTVNIYLQYELNEVNELNEEVLTIRIDK